LEPDRAERAQLAVEVVLEELVPMFGQFPVIFDDDFFVAGVEVVVEPDSGDALAVAALVSLTGTAAVGLARISVFATA
jgi:hypothetical protein